MFNWKKILSWNLDESIYAFEDQLRNQNISFYRKGDTYIINDRGDVFLDSLTSLPNNIEFNNRGYVFLNSLTSLPNNIEFNNRGGVNLFSLTSLPNNIVFNNRGGVNLSSLTSLPNNIVFNNRGGVNLSSLTSLPNNIEFNNGGDVYLDSLTSLPENKYEIFKNGDEVYYNNLNSIFNPHQKESKLSWKESPYTFYSIMGKGVLNKIRSEVYETVIKGLRGGIPNREVIESQIQRLLTSKELDYMDRYYYDLLDNMFNENAF